MKTALEELIEKIKKLHWGNEILADLPTEELLEKEKQQIIEANRSALAFTFNHELCKSMSEEYYKETFNK